MLSTVNCSYRSPFLLIYPWRESHQVVELKQGSHSTAEEECFFSCTRREGNFSNSIWSARARRSLLVSVVLVLVLVEYETHTHQHWWTSLCKWVSLKILIDIANKCRQDDPRYSPFPRIVFSHTAVNIWTFCYPPHQENTNAVKQPQLSNDAWSFSASTAASTWWNAPLVLGISSSCVLFGLLTTSLVLVFQSFLWNYVGQIVYYRQQYPHVHGHGSIFQNVAVCSTNYIII